MTFKSLGKFRRRDRFSIWEAAIAVLSPIIALILRGVSLDVSWTLLPVTVYCVSSGLGGILGLAYFNISKSPSGFVSTVDLIKTFKAALFTAVAGVIATFFATHMQYVPRYVPIIHFFIFSGLIIVLNIWRAHKLSLSTQAVGPNSTTSSSVENQILLGCGPLSVHYAALIDEMPQSQRKIAGIVSICGDLVGSSLGNRIVLGPIENFIEIIGEFRNHGVDIHRVVIAASDQKFQEIALNQVSDYCEENSIAVSFLSDLIDAAPYSERTSVAVHEAVSERTVSSESHRLHSNAYLSRRQRYDWIFAIGLVTVLSPLFVLIWLISFLDIGRPVIFWQQRVGRHGKMITVHKFRTLPHRGVHTDEDQRTPSRVGRFLQITRLDEIPQLFDIVERRLSFIGPRPLLPRDLPENTGGRESVLPGITGWAQVHGGKLISAEEKIALDYWYLNHASLWLDAIILLKTIRIACRGHELRDDRAIDVALQEFEQSKSLIALENLDSKPTSEPESRSGNPADNNLVTNPSAA